MLPPLRQITLLYKSATLLIFFTIRLVVNSEIPLLEAEVPSSIIYSIENFTTVTLRKKSEK
jgi:hypothetical protein